MKIQKTIIAALLALPTILLADTAVFPANLEMLKSKSVLRAFALSRVTRGSISLNDSSQLPGTPDKGYVAVTGTDAEDVAKKLAQAQLSIRVANSADSVYVNAYLESSDGQGIGGDSQNLNIIPLPSGNWAIDPNGPKLELDVYDHAAIPVGNANGAYIIYRDANNNIQWFDYSENIYGGYLYIQMAYAGEIGELILTHSDFGVSNGNITSQAYTLTGSPITASSINGSVGVSVLNFKKVTDAGLAANASLTADIYPILPVGSNQQKGAPVILVKLTSARTVNAYSAILESVGSATSWQTPTKVWYRSGSDGPFNSLPIVPGQPTPIVLPAGTSVISFDFEAFDKDPQQPNYYWGKG